MAFGDVDGNRDGLINAAGLGPHCEKLQVCAQIWHGSKLGKECNCCLEVRTTARAAMFLVLDTRNGPARGTIGSKHFVRWAREHTVKKVGALDMKSNVDFNHVQDFDEDTVMNYLEYALHNPTLDA